MDFMLTAHFTTDDPTVAEAVKALVSNMLPWMVDNVEVFTIEQH